MNCGFVRENARHQTFPYKVTLIETTGPPTKGLKKREKKVCWCVIFNLISLRRGNLEKGLGLSLLIIARCHEVHEAPGQFHPRIQFHV